MGVIKIDKLLFYLEKLLNAQSEDDVSLIIEEMEKVFNVIWKPYGNTTGNYSSFENQQTSAEPSLIEKIMNSIDHNLIKQCLIKNINPSSPEAPESMEEAKEILYTEEELRRENDSITILVDGNKDALNLMLIDRGEGQLPSQFESTLLSLQRGNKNSVKFVQGKFNMGSTGAVVFCGKYKYQLIISKRDPRLADADGAIGFTLVRKHIRTEEEYEQSKSTWYEFLTIDGLIPQITNKEEITLSPVMNNKYKFSSGTVVKMYNYQLKRKTQAFQALKEDINSLLYYPAFPISIHETRECFTAIKNREGKGIKGVAYGNGYLLNSKDFEDKLEYKSVGNKLSGKVFGEAKIDIFLFKEQEKDIAKSIRINKSIVFLMNGQVQYSLNTSYVSSTLGFKLLKESLIITIDCTNLKREFHDDGFFMANRESIKDTENTREFLKEIKEFLQNNEDLIELNKKRASQKISGKGTKEIFERLLGKNKQDNILKNLFQEDNIGPHINKSSKSSNKTSKKTKSEKELNKYPTNIQIRGLENDKKGNYLSTRLGGRSTITIDIDAENAYFRRSDSPGELVIKILKISSGGTSGEEGIASDKTLVNDWFNISQTDLQNGELKLSLSQQSKQIEVDDKYRVDIQIKDKTQEFNNYLFIKIIKPNDKKEKKKKERLVLPPVIQVFRDQETIDSLNRDLDEKATFKTWDELNWETEKCKNKVVEIIPGTSENDVASGIYINMSSEALQRIINEEGSTETGIEQAQEQFLTGIYMQSFLLAAAITRLQNKATDNPEDTINQIEMESFVAGIVEEIAYASVKMQINNIKMANTI